MQNALWRKDRYKGLITKEWLFLGSFLSLVLTSLFFRRLPVYSEKEFQVIIVLLAFFITVKGLERSGFMLRLSQRMEVGRFLEAKLVLTTFVLSMFVTNDVALVMLVPLTLMIQVEKKGTLVILEALAANAGSALTPFGNPQNLFIYWVYGIHPLSFVKTMTPFSLFFLFFILLFTLGLNRNAAVGNPRVSPATVGSKAYSYLLLLAVLILVILHWLPVIVVSLVFLYALVFDRKSLGIDYALLLTFLCFFGLADNLKQVFVTGIHHPDSVFLYTAGISQIISNVPAALLLSKYTTQWQALLWGSNVGGFGSLVASLANLIAYKLYLSHPSSRKKKKGFTVHFLLLGFTAFLMGIGLYFLVKNYGQF